MLQLAANYEVRGLISELTSYNSAAPGSGGIVNDVLLTYNSFGQLITDSQSHSGAVVPGTTPMIQYAYADGSTNTIRPTTLTYPNGRAITTSYGTSGGINDSASRVDGLIDGTTIVVNYAYLGLASFVQTTYPQPSIQYTLLGSSSGNSPAGDIYWGLDLFGRIIDSRWFTTGTSADVDRIKYSYDRASNRIWRQNPVAAAAGAQFDEFYSNDGLQRLKDMKRGTLNGTNTAITSPTFEQCWTLDPSGNWRSFNEAASGTAWTLNQTRTANTVNEITGITNSTGVAWANPAYDPAGNMTTIPQLANSSASSNATYDAWNRLVSITDAGTGQTVQQNQYDARNFRTIRITPSISETRHFYYTAGWQCLEERVGTATTPDRQFLWGARYIDDLILRDRVSERLYAMQDANWNVTSIGNNSGTIQERYSYTPYGIPSFLTNSFVPHSTSSFAMETLYCGYRYDEAIALYCVRFRYFHPSLGNWVQRDPIGRKGSGANLYAYVGNHPTRYSDHFGLQDRPDAIWSDEASAYWGAFGSSIGRSFYGVPQFYYSLGQYAFGNAEGGSQTMANADANSALGQAQQIGPGTYRATAGSLGVASAFAVAAGSLLALEASGGATLQIGWRWVQPRGGGCIRPHFAWRPTGGGWQHATGMPGWMTAESFPQASAMGYSGISGIPILNPANATFITPVSNCFMGTCSAWFNAGGAVPLIGIGGASSVFGLGTYWTLTDDPSTDVPPGLPQSEF